MKGVREEGWSGAGQRSRYESGVAREGAGVVAVVVVIVIVVFVNVVIVKRSVSVMVIRNRSSPTVVFRRDPSSPGLEVSQAGQQGS